MSTIYLDSPPKSGYMEHVKATLVPSRSWLKDAFPVLKWLPKYNRQWLYGDVIAAITVAIVVIPQSMAYGKLIFHSFDMYYIQTQSYSYLYFILLYSKNGWPSSSIWLIFKCYWVLYISLVGHVKRYQHRYDKLL